MSSFTNLESNNNDLSLLNMNTLTSNEMKLLHLTRQNNSVNLKGQFMNKTNVAAAAAAAAVAAINMQRSTTLSSAQLKTNGSSIPSLQSLNNFQLCFS
jgi:uncharacterized protein YfdQ (DUF2303 family)